LKTKISTSFKPQLYTSFAGLNTSRSDVSMERPEAQPFVELDNVYCANTGYLTNEPTIGSILGSKNSVTHIRLLSSESNVAVYATDSDQGVSINTLNRPYSVANAWPARSVVSSTLFDGKAILAGGGRYLYSFDGFEYLKIESEAISGGRYVVQIQDRLAVAGFDSNPNEIVLSRISNPTIFHTEEDVAEASLLKAARFNVQNLIGNGDRIRGITSFENNKFAVFTGDRVLVYLADQDFNNWTLDTRLVVRYGTLSHNSIVSVGDEVFFCSKSGIHSLRRSALNGTTVYTNPLSEDVQELYQNLLALVSDQRNVNAHFNPDDGRLHVFFPVNTNLAYRLSGVLSSSKQEGDVTKIKWSVSKYANAQCGDYLAGRHYYGAPTGIYQVGRWYDNTLTRGPGYALTPILWHKDLFNPKQGLMLVIYASGAGTLFVDAEDETGRKLGTYEFVMPDQDEASYAGVPLQRQFTRPFSHSYTGVRLRIRFEASKMIRLFGLGILTKEQ